MLNTQYFNYHFTLLIMQIQLNIHPQIKSLLYSKELTTKSLRQIILYVGGALSELFNYCTGEPFTHKSICDAIFVNMINRKKAKTQGGSSQAAYNNKINNFTRLVFIITMIYNIFNG